MKGTKNIKDLLYKTNFQKWASEKGYHILSIDSQNGGYLDGKMMNKEKFMTELKELGSDHDTKLLVFHYEMIAEGIDVKGFTGVCFMRSSLNNIFITQTIGRCIRAAGEWKKYGVVSIVEHEDDTSEVSDLTKQIVVSLLEHGVPLDSIFTEMTGRGESEEVIGDLQNQFAKSVKQIEMNWLHQNLLEEYRDKSVGQLMNI
jgi:predicted helicase